MVMTDGMIEVALMSGRKVETEQVRMIEESTKKEDLGVAKEQVEVATVGVAGVGEVMVVEVKKAKVEEKGVNQVAMEENPHDYQVTP